MKFKRKKNVKFRGGSSHGWGAKKKHRGAGNRGGRGMAGSGKRADQKKISILKFKKGYFGKKGFKRPGSVVKTDKIINICDLKDHLNNKKDGFYLVELKGYKLLGKGQISKKFKNNYSKSSKLAEEKIKKAGGEVNVIS